MEFLIDFTQDKHSTYRLEAMHDFVGKLGSNGVVREWFVEVGKGSGRGNVTPV